MKLYHQTWFILLIGITMIGIPVAIILVYLQRKYLRENTFDRNSDYAQKELDVIIKKKEEKRKSDY